MCQSWVHEHSGMWVHQPWVNGHRRVSPWVHAHSELCVTVAVDSISGHATPMGCAYVPGECVAQAGCVCVAQWPVAQLGLALFVAPACGCVAKQIVVLEWRCAQLRLCCVHLCLL